MTFLFDFDGTLVDSMPAFSALMLRILDDYSIKYDSETVKIITPLGYRGTAEYYTEQLGLPESVPALIEKMNSLAKHDYENVIPEKEGVGETLRALKAMGASLNVLTASPHAALDPCLTRLGLMPLFDNVWSCDDFGTTKSDPNIYVLAARALGKEVGDVTFIDDNINAVKTAMKAGMRAFGIYDESGADFESELKAIADGYLYKMSDLLKLL